MEEGTHLSLLLYSKLGFMVGRISIKILGLFPLQTQRALCSKGHKVASLCDHRAQLGAPPFLKGFYMVALFHLRLVCGERRLTIKQ